MASLRRCIEFMTAELETLEAEWESLLAGCPEQQEIRKNILTVPGVGRATARVVVSELYATIGENTQANNASPTPGLAPQEQTSGTSLGAQRKALFNWQQNIALRSIHGPPSQRLETIPSQETSTEGL